MRSPALQIKSEAPGTAADLRRHPHPPHLCQSHGENGEFVRGRDADAAGEDVVIGAADALEQRVIDGDEHPERGAAFAVDERQ
jgi:hypothetical protein